LHLKINYLFPNIVLLVLYFLRLFFWSSFYILSSIQYWCITSIQKFIYILSSVSMYHQHTLLFYLVFNLIHYYIYKMKSNKPRTEPWESPHLTGRLLDKHSFNWFSALCI
jgi:hypothetical protein